MPEPILAPEATDATLPAFATLAFAHAGRNVLNPEAADALAADLAKRRLSLMEGARPAQIEAWLKTTARKEWIKKGPSEAVGMQEAAATGKPWALLACEAGTLVRLDLGDGARIEAMGVIDYLLAREDVRLARLSYADARDQSVVWHAEVASKRSTEEDLAGLVEYAVVAGGDGQRWVEIKSEQALVHEGHVMRHCVGSYVKQVATSQCRIFSLRDRENKSHLTVEAVGLDEDGNPVKHGSAASFRLEQIRGVCNAMPMQEQAPALRSLLEKMAANNTPVSDARELVSCGAVLDPKTGVLRLFTEVEDGYAIDSARFYKGVPAGIERLRFTKLSLDEFRPDAPLVVHAKEVELANCRAAELRVTNLHPHGRLIVRGMEGVGTAWVSSRHVEMECGAKGAQRNWLRPGQFTPGEGGELTPGQAGGLIAMLGAPARQKRVDIHCRSGRVRGVRAEVLAYVHAKLNGDDPSSGQEPLEVAQCALGSIEAPASDVIVLDSWVGGIARTDKMETHPWGQAQASRPPEDEAMRRAPERFRPHEERVALDALADRGPLSLLDSALRDKAALPWVDKRIAWAAKEIARQFGKVSFLVGSSLNEPGVEAHAQGNLFMASLPQMGVAWRARSANLARAAMELDKKQPWRQALLGAWDPRGAAGGGAGEVFGLRAWAERFRVVAPKVAQELAKCLPSPERIEMENPEALAMVVELCGARAWLGSDDAKRLWDAARKNNNDLPEAKNLDFGVDGEDPALARFGPWRFAGSLINVVAPLDASGEREWGLVPEDSCLRGVIPFFAGQLRQPDGGGVRGRVGDMDEDGVVVEHYQHTMIQLALAWPLGEVELRARPKAPVEIARVARLLEGPHAESIASACIGTMLAQASGQPERAAEMAGAVQDMLWVFLNKEGSAAARDVQRGFAVSMAAKTHIQPPAKANGSIGEEDVSMRIARGCGKSHEEWLSESSGVGSMVVSSQSSQPLAYVDFEALGKALEALDASPVLMEASALALEQRGASVGLGERYVGLARSEMLAAVQGLGDGLATQGEIESVAQAAKRLWAGEFGAGGVGCYDEEGLAVDEFPWLLAATLGKCSAQMRDALDEWRTAAYLAMPAGALLGAMDLSDEAMEEAAKKEEAQGGAAMKPEEARALRDLARMSAQAAREKLPGLPASDRLAVAGGASPLKLARALIGGAKEGRSAGEALGIDAEWLTVQWSRKTRQLLGMRILDHKSLPVEARDGLMEGLIDALAYLEHRQRERVRPR